MPAKEAMPTPPNAPPRAQVTDNTALLASACVGEACHCPKKLGAVLAHKYGALHDLRRSHDALSVDPTPMQAPGAQTARHRQLRGLAAVYPGALRELLRLDAAQLQVRAEHARLASGQCAPTWLRVVFDYHVLWHRGLAYRRFAAQVAPPSGAHGAARPTLVSCFASWYERAATTTPWASEVLPDAWQEPAMRQACGHKESPGRLALLVRARLVSRYQLRPSEVGAALWGPMHKATTP